MLLTVGWEGDLQYFLPRLFELVSTSSESFSEPEIVIGKLLEVEWREWPQEQLDALEEFFEAAFVHFVMHESWHEDAWLCALAHTDLDFPSLLKRVKECDTALIEIYEWNNLDKKSDLSGSFWDKVPEKAKQLVLWYQTDEIQNGLTEAYVRKYQS